VDALTIYFVQEIDFSAYRAHPPRPENVVLHQVNVATRAAV